MNGQTGGLKTDGQMLIHIYIIKEGMCSYDVCTQMYEHTFI